MTPEDADNTPQTLPTDAYSLGEYTEEEIAALREKYVDDELVLGESDTN